LDDDLDLLKCAGTVSDMCYAIKVRRILCSKAVVIFMTIKSGVPPSVRSVEP